MKITSYQVSEVGDGWKTLFHNQFEGNSGEKQCDSHCKSVSSSRVNGESRKCQADD